MSILRVRGCIQLTGIFISIAVSGSMDNLTSAFRYASMTVYLRRSVLFHNIRGPTTCWQYQRTGLDVGVQRILTLGLARSFRTLLKFNQEECSDVWPGHTAVHQSVAEMHFPGRV